MQGVDLFQIVRLDERSTFFEVIEEVDINQINEEGQNLLHEAIGYRRDFLGGELVRRSIDLNHQDREGQTPLHYAAVHGETKLAELIFVKGASLAIADRHGNQPLWTAVFNAKENCDMVQMLMKHGASPTHKNRYGKSPLDLARQIGDEELVGILEGEGK